MKDRVAAAGLAMKVEEKVSCCYAVQDKIWVADPDGNKWEVFVVLDNEASQHMSRAGSYCPDSVGCCTETSKAAVEVVTLGSCR